MLVSIVILSRGLPVSSKLNQESTNRSVIFLGKGTLAIPHTQAFTLWHKQTQLIMTESRNPSRGFLPDNRRATAKSAKFQRSLVKTNAMFPQKPNGPGSLHSPLPPTKKQTHPLVSSNGQKWTYKAINKQRFTPSPAFQHKDGFTLGRRGGEEEGGKNAEKFLRVN